VAHAAICMLGAELLSAFLRGEEGLAITPNEREI